ncbi:hypothetical protein DL771_003937 [Monosporascus sp. 5C6A]|nr:hypothetical protein DL771_003937 [Monosporascus sp. 5C6A]
MSSSTLSTSTGNAPAPRVPAWKRLGLKLKSASGESHTRTAPTTDAAAPPHASAPAPQKWEQVNGSASAKRKPSGALKSDHSAKKARSDLPEVQTPRPSKKSVVFAAEVTESPTPAAANGTQAAASKKPKQPTKPKSASGAGLAAIPAAAAAKASKSPGKQGPVNLEPALAYLRQWHTSRDSWKFNKNHQTRLLEQVFADETTIPAVDIGVFYAYIRGLKGGVRARLRELARGIRARDMEQGTDGFSAAASNNGNNNNNNKKNDKEAAAQAQRKQKEYEDVIAAFLGRDRAPGERRFDEVDYVLRTTDMEMQRRVVKRMRAETVLEELADGDEEAASTASTTLASTSSSSNSSGGGTTIQNGDGNADAEDGKRLQLNDGSQQRVKRRRLRKARTAGEVEDESSSSSSSSESESSSSSDSSSSDDDDDRQGPERPNNPKRKGAEASTSSSSSSSSSSSDDSESESESESEDSSDDD